MAAAILLVGQGTARAAARTWTGAVSNLWNVGGNWTGNSVPVAGDTATINSGTVSINANVSVTSITITGGAVSVSGATTTIATTGNFTVSGGTFTGGTASANTITVGGNLNISNTDSSLIGYWKLDETSGSTAADSSGNGNSLTYTFSAGSGPVPSASVPSVGFQDSRSLSFVTANRDAALTTIPAQLRPSLPITVSAWYRATSMDTNAGEIASGNDSYVLRLSDATNGVDVVKRTAVGTWVTLSSSPANFLDGNWHQVVGVFATTGMTVYFDGVAVNSNTDTTAIYYATPYANFAIGRNGGTNLLCDFNGNIDDVRVYSRALSAAEVSILASGSQAGTFALSSPLSVTGSVTVQSTGTLALSGASATVTMANNQTLTMDGTLTSSTSAATGPAIQCSSAATTDRFHFYVGSTNGAAPTLNVSNLTVKHTDANGMRINGNGSGTTTATTTFKQFDGVAFKEGTTGAGSSYLQIYGQTLYLISHGCSFGAGEASTALPAAAVRLTGNGFTNGATETRALFGGTTCAATWTGGGADTICTSTAKVDDDATSDGIGDNAGSNGAVVQFVRTAKSDINGTVEGLPTAAFNWSNFTYYSTYIAAHDADPSGTKDRVYVRQSDGSAASSTYYWEAPAGETIVGTPRWNTIGSTHYVFVAMASGDVYALVDNTSARTLSTTGAGWATNPYTTPSSITSPLASDTSNLYFGGTAGNPNRVFAIRQVDGTSLTGSPYSVSGPVAAATPAVWSSAGVTYFTLGVDRNNARITHIDINNSLTTFSNNAPAGPATGRIGYATKNNATLFVGDEQGNMYGITPTDALNLARWSYSVGATTALSPSYYDYTGDTLMFGTAAGRLYSLSAATGTTAAIMTGYSGGYQPNSNGDPFTGAPLYSNGILAAGNVGSATGGGKLYLIDRNSSAASPCTASGPTLLAQYNFGPSVTVSGVGYDSSTNRYMVTTSSTISDGSLFYIDRVTDPTSVCN